MVTPTTPLEVASWIAGEPQPGSTVIRRENPALVEETVSEVLVADEACVARAVTLATTASSIWASTAVAERCRLINTVLAEISQSADAIAMLEAREIGKPLNDCLAEASSAIAISRYVMDHAEGVLEPSIQSTAQRRLEVHRRPFGVVAAIVPWNAPLNLTMAKVVPALAAGNTIVVKPSPLAAGTTTMLLHGFSRHLPAGVVSVVQGDAATGRALVEHPSVRKVSFTGGREAARHVLRSSADRLVPTTMELGGNDAAIVLEDAQLTDSAIERAVRATFRNAGQVCMAAKRWYIASSRLDEFTARFKEASDRLLRLGNPLDSRTTLGPVVDRRARQRLEGLRDASTAAGGRVMELGTPAPDLDAEAGHFVTPSLVLGAGEDWPVVAEEQFGPIVPILDFVHEDDAVARANATNFGLAASVWSADLDRASAVAGRLDVGYTFINTHNTDGLAIDAPFGGVKESGYGRELGSAGLEEYSTTHVVHAPPHVMTPPFAGLASASADTALSRLSTTNRRNR
jgi:acyl-CoA reductase-like NAD-dependent aldehyde dehydrogenase